MPKWTATIKGVLCFERDITVYACNAEDAKVVARELTEKSVGADDDCTIDSIEILPATDDTDFQYEVALKMKEAK